MFCLSNVERLQTRVSSIDLSFSFQITPPTKTWIKNPIESFCFDMTKFLSQANWVLISSAQLSVSSYHHINCDYRLYFKQSEEMPTNL